MSDLRENSEEHKGQEVDEDPNPIEVLDIGLGVVNTTDAQFRFNQDDIYIARETSILARCSLVDCAHGKLSADNPVPCTLLVFDFQLDRVKSSRVIHSAIITLVTKRITRILTIAPEDRLNTDSLELTVENSDGVEGEIGVDKWVKATVKPRTGTNTQAMRIKYATAKGWTTHYPRARPNDSSPHDCVKWSLQENPAKEDEGVPPHFRAAVLLERRDDDEFQLEMEIEAKADLLTTFEGLFLKSVEKGRLTIDPSKASTSRLKKYRIDLGEEDLGKIAQLSLGTLQERIFGTSG